MPSEPEVVPAVVKMRSAARYAAEHHVLVASSASIASFGYARLTVALFCWPLGIAPSDLGLSFQDYLLIAALWLVFLLLPFGAIKLRGIATRPIEDRSQWSWQRRATRWVLGVALIGVVYLAVAASGTPWSLNTTVWIAFAGFMALFVGAFIAQWAIPFKAKPTTTAACVLTLFVAISGCVLSWSAGSHLAHGPPNKRPLPLPIQLALAPSEGVAVIDGQEVCAVRVAPRVYVTAEKVIVTDVESFSPSDCRS